MDAFCDKFIEGDMGMAATRLFVSMNFITAHKKRKNLNTSPPPLKSMLTENASVGL